MKKLLLTLTTFMTLLTSAHAISHNRCIDKYDSYHKKIKKIVTSVRLKADSFENCVDKKLAFTSGSCSAIRSLESKVVEAANSLEDKMYDLKDVAGDVLSTANRCSDSNRDTIAEDLWELQEFAEDEADEMKKGSSYSRMGDYYFTILSCLNDTEREAKKKNCN